MKRPEIKDHPLYQLLRIGGITEFNERRAAGETCDLEKADLRGIDLRNMDVRGLNMRSCYLRQADLRGVNFTETELEGASISGAKISGTYFPHQLSAEEITLSLLHGTRMRYSR